MKYILVGLGNPGEEYINTRHNIGRYLVQSFAEKKEGEFSTNSSRQALISQIEIEDQKVICILPETFMNRSGKSLLKDIKTSKKYDNLVVVHDDLDLPLGKIKLSFGKSCGGHRGVDSIIKVLKTKDFLRLRIGVSAENSKGVARKPKGEEAVIKYVLGKFSTADKEKLAKIEKRVFETLSLIFKDGYIIAMNNINSNSGKK